MNQKKRNRTILYFGGINSPHPLLWEQLRVNYERGEELEKENKDQVIEYGTERKDGIKSRGLEARKRGEEFSNTRKY